jgi:hypothetical protein
MLQTETMSPRMPTTVINMEKYDNTLYSRLVIVVFFLLSHTAITIEYVIMYILNNANRSELLYTNAPI